MPIYTAYADISRVLYLCPVDEVAQIEIKYTQENFDNIKIRYSYAFDNSTWSEWDDTVEDLLRALDTDNRPYDQVYIKAEFSAWNDRKSLELLYVCIDDVLINAQPVEVTHIEAVETSDILERYNTTPLYQPYRNSERIQQLNLTLAKGVSDVLGFDCVYYRTEPKETSENVSLKTFGSYVAVDKSTIKIVIKDNEIPSNRYQYDEFDIGFVDEMEVHIVKEEFSNRFGEGYKPNSKDFLFLHLTNRMYKINTVFEDNTFMNQATYYTAMLVKYEDGASVDKEEFEFELDAFIDPVEEHEIEKLTDEQVDATKEFEFDNVNTEIDETVTLDEVEHTHDNNAVFNRMYDLSGTESTEAIKHEFTSNDEYGILLWYQGNGEATPFTVHNEESDSKLTLTRQNDGYFRIDSVSKTRTVTLIADGTPIYDDKLYGVVVNYICNTRGKYITLSILNDEYETVQENSTSTFDKLLPTTNITIHGGSQLIGNLRVKKQFISKKFMKDFLVDRLPTASEYYIIDNNVPEIIGEKLRPV